MPRTDTDRLGFSSVFICMHLWRIPSPPRNRSRRAARARAGFTLLEVLVATVIMAIAVAGALSSLSASVRNAARVTEYDRAAMLAKRQMDELLANDRLPRGVPIEGRFDPVTTGGVEAGWRAQAMPFEAPPGTPPGMLMIQRIELQVWWKAGGQTKTFTIEGFRRAWKQPEDMALGVMAP